MSTIRDLPESEFEATIQKSDKPVLVDFSAAWCQPCKALAPTIEAIASEYEGKLDVYKVDIDEAQDTAVHFNVRGVPTCIFFKTGKEVDRFTGIQDLRSVKERVEKVLSA